MSDSSDKDGDTPAPKPTKATVLLMLSTMADTTWRMFVPTFGLAGLGAWGDHTYGTEPWLAVGGLVLGIFITGFLIKQQLATVRK